MADETQAESLVTLAARDALRLKRCAYSVTCTVMPLSTRPVQSSKAVFCGDEDSEHCQGCFRNGHEDLQGIAIATTGKGKLF